MYLRSDGLPILGRPYCWTSGTKDYQRDGVPLTLVVDVIASALRAEGVEMLSCYPTTPMIDAATRAGIRPVVCRQERVGVGIARRLQSRDGGEGFGVFAMQFGPGAENAFAGIALRSATGFRCPSVCCRWESVDRDPRLVPLFMPPRSYRVGDQVRMRRSSVTAGLVCEDDALGGSRAANGRPGTGHGRDPGRRGNDDRARCPGAVDYEPVTDARSRPIPTSGERVAVRRLGAARRPVIRGGARRARRRRRPTSSSALRRMLDLPVVSTLGGKSAIAETHRCRSGSRRW